MHLKLRYGLSMPPSCLERPKAWHHELNERHVTEQLVKTFAIMELPEAVCPILRLALNPFWLEA